MIKSISTKPYKFLWLSIPLIVIVILICPRGTFDLQLHDTYFVITSNQVAIISSIFLGLVGLLYWLLKEFDFVIWLRTLTVVSTIICVIGLILLSIFQIKIVQNNFQFYRPIQYIGWLLLFIFLITQFLFILNLGIALKKGKL